MNVQPFSPDYANTKIISATSTSSNVAIAAVDINTGTLGQGYNVMRIVNAGPNVAFIRWGVPSTTTAVVTDMPMLPGTVEVFTNSPDTAYVAAICAATQTATIYITPGEGF